MEIIRTVFCSHKFVKIRLFVLVGLMGLNLSGCTAIAVTGALSTATKAVVSVVTLPVKAVTSIAGGDDEEAETQQADQDAHIETPTKDELSK